MIPVLSSIISFFDEIAPPGLTEAWDNSGLQLGDASREIHNILITLDPSAEAVKKVSEMGHGRLIITHHPLIFKPLKRLDLSVWSNRLIEAAVKNDVSVISVHTNFDAAKEGISHIIADVLGLEKTVPLIKSGNDGEGLGRLGVMPHPMILKDFVLKIKKTFSLERVGFVGSEDKIISKVAVVGGSGGSLIYEAVANEADVFVSGDLGYHHVCEALESGMALVDAGHYRMECMAFRVFSEKFRNRCKQLNWNVNVLWHERKEIDIINYI